MSAMTRRRVWQFRLRTLFVAVTMLGVCCGWVGNTLYHYRVEQSIVRKLPRAAYVESEWHGPFFMRETWVESISPVLNRVAGINFSDTNLTDEQFADLPLERLRRLHWLNLGAGEMISARVYRYEPTPITDDTLRYFWRLPQLQGLGLCETQITDAGLLFLGQCPNLIGLDIDKTGVTDAGLESLLQCPNLQRLSLVRTSVSDAGLIYLEKLERLEYLDVRDTSVTDDGALNLQTALPHCEIRR
jgi:hypothetical protein